MAARLKRKRFKTSDRYEHVVNVARSGAGRIGYDIRRVRQDWYQTQQEFGYMMGQGLLGGVMVGRWEMGLELPPGFVLMWVDSQLLTMRYRGGRALTRLDWIRRIDQRPLTCPHWRDAVVGYGRVRGIDV